MTLLRLAMSCQYRRCRRPCHYWLAFGSFGAAGSAKHLAGVASNRFAFKTMENLQRMGVRHVATFFFHQDMTCQCKNYTMYNAFYIPGLCGGQGPISKACGFALGAGLGCKTRSKQGQLDSAEVILCSILAVGACLCKET